MESWKPIQGHIGYEVSSTGKVRRMSYVKTYSDGSEISVESRPLTLHAEDDGLHVNFDGKNYVVHRLVAEAFLGTPTVPSYVQFKDLDKYNCDIENLYYATISSVIRTAIQEGKRQAPSAYRGMVVKCIETSQTWPSIQSLATDLQLSRAIVSRRIRNNRPINNYHYQFV